LNAPINKYPYQKDSYYIDFIEQLNAGETITSFTVTSQLDFWGTFTDSTAEIISTTPAPSLSGTQVTFWYQAGNAGERHVVSVDVVTSGGRQLVGVVDLNVLQEE